MKRFFIVVFVLVAIVHLTAQLMGWSPTDDITKCILLPALCGYYLASGRRSIILVLGLFFCWLGDVLLIFDGEAFFLGGLAAFLTGHLFYIFTYRQHQYEDLSNGLLVPQKIRFSLPIVLAGTGLFVVLLPRLGDLMVPVLFYSIVITVMTMTALFRYGLTLPRSFWLVFTGAVVFMISDTILAFNMLVGSLPMAGFWIMLTYITAQFLIVEGIREHG